jgi:hypothetical protein
MQRQDEADVIRNDRFALPGVPTGALGLALLFGSAAIALAMILTPIAEGLGGSQSAAGDDIDRTITGSTDSQTYYTIRRSILQPSPESVCIIRANGQRSGDC